MNKLTIQINNLEALERLIGGDSEVEVDIRNSIVQKFAEKHLKPLANSDAIDKTLTDIKTEIYRQISDKCSDSIAKFQKSWGGSITDVKLHANVLAEINSKVRDLVDRSIHDSVQEAIKFWANDKEIEERIKKKFDYYTNDFISNEIKERLEKLKKQL